MKTDGILFIGYFLSNFGYGRCVCEDLSSRFEGRGYRVITTSSKKNRLSRILDMVITIINKRKEYQVAYVEVYNGLAFLWSEIVCALLRILRKPYIITLHGARMLPFSQSHPKRVNRMLQNASLVTTPSKLFTEKLAYLRPDIIYLPNAIDITDFPFLLRATPLPHMAWLRRFEYNYNPLLAVKVVDRLLDEFPGAKLYMGGGDFHDGSSSQVKEYIQAKKINENVKLAGYVSRTLISEWFNQSDIYLNTTNVESFGIAVMEAAAAGLCVVTTNAGELPYIWQNEFDALVVPQDNPEEMATAVRRILKEPGLAARLSMNARRKAEQYDWSAILPRWEELFNKAMEHG